LKKPLPTNSVLDGITSFYLESKDFNGIPVGTLCKQHKMSCDELRQPLNQLLEDNLICVVFGDIHPNPHIKAFPDEPKQEQSAKLLTDALNSACIYPSQKQLDEVVDRQQFTGQPFTLCLALGEAKLSFKSFDLSVLEHYREDPRYYYDNNDIDGFISVSDKYIDSHELTEKDKIVLQTFGFSYDDDLNRAVAVFLKYLADLSPEHQQIWHAKMLHGEYTLHPDYYRSCILGEFHERISIFDAFIEELGIIKEMCKLIGKPNLFREDFRKRQKPRNFSFLIRPTLAEYNEFILLLDKLMSDNINKDFFRGQIKLETEQTRSDGKIQVSQKGTITLLSEWLNKYYRPRDQSPIVEMLNTFRKIRKQRQHPAHSVEENIFDNRYIHEQRQMILEAYGSIRTLRLILANHPKVKTANLEIHPDVYEGKIWTK